MITYAVDFSENGREWLALTDSDIVSFDEANNIARQAWEQGKPQVRVVAFDPGQGAVVVALYK